ncbi:hypothetical protein QUF80_08285 [Desulfococcaceae bacterium HSG8]|nr:hypothetical protein [Desulfococcaceae bacterium HSG8]
MRKIRKKKSFITHYSLRITHHHVSRFTFHASRFTHHASRFTRTTCIKKQYWKTAYGL